MTRLPASRKLKNPYTGTPSRSQNESFKGDASIRSELENATGRSSVRPRHTTLDRLEGKGRVLSVADNSSNSFGSQQLV